MAKHRAPRTPRRYVRRTLRYVAGLPFRALVLVGRTLLATPRAAWWLARGLAVGTLGLAWCAFVLALVALATLGGRHGGELRNKIITHLLEPFGKRAERRQQSECVPADRTPGPLPRQHTNPSTLAKDIDPSPDLWPPMGQLTDDLGEEDDQEESIGILAIKGLSHTHSTSKARARTRQG